MIDDTYDDGTSEAEDFPDDGSPRRNGRAEELSSGDAPSRDARGRWVKGHCPNPKGRPRKRPMKIHEAVDLALFSSTMIDIRLNGETQLIDKRSALLEKMYQEAMNGKGSMLKYLFEKMEKSESMLAEAGVLYDDLVMKWITNNRRGGKQGYELPLETELQMTQLRSLLNHHYPRSYPMPGKKKR